MSQRIDRRTLVHRVTASLGALAATQLLGPGALLARRGPKPPPLAQDAVKAFVRAAHSKLDIVKQLLADEPGLVNATWDWGGGDFETALGGASHMGRPDIAEVLLAAGGRLDLFCATMMGKTDIVKSCIADNPAIVNVKGPHGITLLKHAQIAKQDALAKLLVDAGAV